MIGDPDPNVESKAKKHRLGFDVSDNYSIPFEKTMIVESGVRVPWDLLPAAWAYLDRWDLATPLWRYGETAADIGTAEERDLTRSVIRDLRVLLYYHELLFVRKSDRGIKMIEKWIAEMERGPDRRLAFLRAYYQVKPILCAVPISWSADVRSASIQTLRSRNPRIARMKKSSLVRVEVSPGRFVKCHRNDVERIKKEYASN